MAIAVNRSVARAYGADAASRRPATYEIDIAARMLMRIPKRPTERAPAASLRARRRRGKYRMARSAVHDHAAPTIAERSSARDVARLAGVSTATVSRALNMPA